MIERKDYFEELDKKIGEITEEHALEDAEGGMISRGLFTTKEDGTGIALYETSFYDVWEDMPLIEIEVTPQFPITEEGVTEVEKLIAAFNFTVPLGTMGIHYETARMYYRYVYSPSMDNGGEKLAEQTVEFYKKMANIIGGTYDLFERIANGDSTYEEEASKNENLRQ